MPVVFLLAGALLVVVGYQGTAPAFFQQLKQDLFTSTPNFFEWAIALGVIVWIGALGNDARKISNYMLVLLAVVLLISNKGFFTKFPSELKAGTT